MFWETLHHLSFLRLGSFPWDCQGTPMPASVTMRLPYVNEYILLWMYTRVGVYVDDSAGCLLDAVKYINHPTSTASCYPPSHIMRNTLLSILWSFSFNISPSNEHQDWSPLGWTGWSPCSPSDSQESSPTPQFKSINSSVLSFLYSPTLTSIHDHWKNHSLD